MDLAKRGREVTRVEAFSDAVFAFSATLLVVSLEVPKTFPELLSDLKGFAAFGLSFAALILIWAVHNAFFRRYGLQDHMTVALNACLLFVVLFYVYPLKFVAEGLVSSIFHLRATEDVRISSADELGTVFVLYSAGFVAVFASVALMYLHAARSAQALELTPGERREAFLLFRHYLIFVFVGLLSVALAAGRVGLRVGLPGLIYSLLGPLCWAHGVASRRRQRQDPITPPAEAVETPAAPGGR